MGPKISKHSMRLIAVHQRQAESSLPCRWAKFVYIYSPQNVSFTRSLKKSSDDECQRRRRRRRHHGAANLAYSGECDVVKVIVFTSMHEDLCRLRKRFALYVRSCTFQVNVAGALVEITARRVNMKRLHVQSNQMHFCRCCGRKSLCMTVDVHGTKNSAHKKSPTARISAFSLNERAIFCDYIRRELCRR